MTLPAGLPGLDDPAETRRGRLPLSTRIAEPRPELIQVLRRCRLGHIHLDNGLLLGPCATSRSGSPPAASPPRTRRRPLCPAQHTAVAGRAEIRPPQPGRRQGRLVPRRDDAEHAGRPDGRRPRGRTAPMAGPRLSTGRGAVPADLPGTAPGRAPLRHSRPGMEEYGGSAAGGLLQNRPAGSLRRRPRAPLPPPPHSPDQAFRRACAPAGRRGRSLSRRP